MTIHLSIVMWLPLASGLVRDWLALGPVGVTRRSAPQERTTFDLARAIEPVDGSGQVKRWGNIPFEADFVIVELLWFQRGGCYVER